MVRAKARMFSVVGAVVLAIMWPRGAQAIEVLWGASSGTPQDGKTPATWRDWEKMVDLGGTGIQRGRAVFLYQSEFGLFPYAGVHQVEMDPTWMARHRQRILAGINTAIPDPNYSGLAIIDYEHWGFSWNTLYNAPNPGGGLQDVDLDFKDDWREYVRLYRPDLVQGLSSEQAELVFRDLYDQAARAFITETIRYARGLRPNAKWGFYLIPYRSYYDVLSPLSTSMYQAFLRQEIGWLYAEQDAFFPDIYSLYLTEGDDQPPAPFRDHATQYANYLSYSIQVAMDAAQGKPVYPIVWMRYHENAGPYAGQFVNAINMQFPIRIADQMSTQGVVIWEAFGSTPQAVRYQNFVDTQLRPFLREYLDRCPADFDGDQAMTIDDLTLFLTAYQNGRDSADISNSLLTQQPDASVNIDDLLFLLERFANGC